MSRQFTTPGPRNESQHAPKKLAIGPIPMTVGIRLSAARGSIGNVVRQSLGDLRVTEDDISNVAGVGVIDHFGARKARYGSTIEFREAIPYLVVAGSSQDPSRRPFRPPQDEANY